MTNIKKPVNSNAHAMYLLYEAGKKGITNNEAVKKDEFHKFASRVSDLILKYGIDVDKKQEKGKNRFGHTYMRTRYFLKSPHKTTKIYSLINQ